MVTTFLEELGFPQNRPTLMHCDNTSAIHIIKNSIRYPTTKHIEIRYLYARQQYEKKEIDVKYCNTNDMIADMLTKALPTKQFTKLRKRLGVMDTSQS